MKTQSVWEQVRLPRNARLREDRKCDVVVIGGGIMGLTAAYLFKRAGKSVCLLERDRLAAGDTARTTAHLTYVTDTRLSTLVKDFGLLEAALTWQAGSAAINTIEAIAHEQHIGCDFQRIPGFLHAALCGRKDETKDLKADCALAVELGFDATFLPSVPYIDRPGIRFSNQAKFHPRKYLRGLAAAVEGDGSTIHEGSEVTEVEERPLAVKTDLARVECEYVVIATHVPLMGKAGLMSASFLQSKLMPYSSYALSAKIPHGTLPEASFWDTADPYYYLRVDAGPTSDEAIFGGEDHKTGQVQDTDARFVRLEKMLLQLIPRAEVTRRWSGQVIETNDGLPYIGETAERQFVGTGFSGNGITFGTLAAMMACDRLLGRHNPWEELFDVRRTKIRGGTWDLLRENIDYPYYLLRDRLLSANTKTAKSVKRGEGKVVKIDGQRVALSRDAQGKLQQVSAVCTHLGCIVHWNNAEKTWDCPCHGSRFRPNGEVLAGPAESPLEPIKPEAKRRRRKSPAGSRAR